MKLNRLAILAGMLLVIPATVSAQSVQFDLRNGNVRVGEERRAPPPPRYDPRRDDRRDSRRGPPPSRGCSPREAVSAASRYVDRARIVGETRHVYIVEGYGKRGGNRGRPDGVRISKAPDCARSM